MDLLSLLFYVIYIYISHTEPIEGHTTIFDAYVPVPSHTHMEACMGRSLDNGTSDPGE